MAAKNNRRKNDAITQFEEYRGSVPRVLPPKVFDSRKPPGSKPTQKTK